MSDKAVHTFEDGICNVCGYEKVEPLSGVFSVSSSKQVKFSKGALYWDGWLFKVEKNQYDFRTWEGYTSVIGGEQTTEIPTGETGLFFWSGKIEDTYSGLYNDTEGTVSDTFPLANGGAIEGWDVLSSGEWDYLLSEREDASSKFGHATITTEHEVAVHGLVLLPDSWTLPGDCGWTAGGDDYWNMNMYDATQWASMEQACAVFLPAAGYRWFDACDVKNTGK